MSLEFLFPSHLKEKSLEEKFYYSVREIIQQIKRLVDNNFSSFIWIEGEISNLSPKQNGHIYLSLVEGEVYLRAIIFREQKESINVNLLKNGLKVLAYGRLYGANKSGEVFFSIRKIEAKGLGLLYLKKEFLRQKYQHLFAPELKRKLPYFPKKVGVITSLFGAALQDFLKIAKERWVFHLLIYPVKVQGEGAFLEIVQAIEDFNCHFSDLDLIVITRGGGSMEDLAPFNTEEIILAIRNSKIPIVSAVGHEIDITLSDLAADKRCATPTAAAQEIFPNKKDFLQNLKVLRKKLDENLQFKLTFLENRLQNLQIRLKEKNPFLLLIEKEKFLKDLKFRLYEKIRSLLRKREEEIIEFKTKLEKRHPERLIELKEEKLRGLKKLLFSLSPYKVLERGYSIVKTYPEGEVVREVKELYPGKAIEITLFKGKVYATIWKVEE